MHSSLPLAAERLFFKQNLFLYPSRRPCLSHPCRSQGGRGVKGALLGVGGRGMFLIVLEWDGDLILQQVAATMVLEQRPR